MNNTPLGLSTGHVNCVCASLFCSFRPTSLLCHSTGQHDSGDAIGRTHGVMQNSDILQHSGPSKDVVSEVCVSQ